MNALRWIAGLMMLMALMLAQAAEPAGKGQPLPEDGGEPGKVVLALMAAQRSGDFEQWKTWMHPRVWQGKEEALQSMLERGKKYSPTAERILGGTIDGDHATIKIEASFPSASRTTDADLEKYEGKWRVTRI
ncbi:MAG: hypothetical protein ABI650_06165 [Dokdonella sp.]